MNIRFQKLGTEGRFVDLIVEEDGRTIVRLMGEKIGDGLNGKGLTLKYHFSNFEIEEADEMAPMEVKFHFKDEAA